MKKSYFISIWQVTFITLLAPLFMLNCSHEPTVLHRTPADSKSVQTENKLLVFNPVHRSGMQGEVKEFTTLDNLKRYLKQSGTTSEKMVIALGDRSGTAQNPVGRSGEVFVQGLYGNAGDGLEALSADDTTGTPEPLKSDDVMVFNAAAVFDPRTPLATLVYDRKQDAGTVLWNFSHDDTIFNFKVAKFGFFNSFSKVDHGLTENFYLAAQDAQNQTPKWKDDSWRPKLAKYFPSLKDDEMWKNTKGSLAQGLLFSEWLPLIHKAGYTGAAVVIKGSMMNVNQMRVLRINRKGPQQSVIAMALTGKKPQDVTFESFPETGDWMMVGIIADFDRQDAFYPSAAAWKDTFDQFGGGYHFHGKRLDGTKLGHTLTAMQGTERLEVSLYPLDFTTANSASIFQNSLELDCPSLKISAAQDQVQFQVRKKGQNFARDVVLRVRSCYGDPGNDDGCENTDSNIAMMRPDDVGAKESFVQAVQLDLSKPLSSPGLRRVSIIVDPDNEFLESTSEQKNNVAEIFPQVRCHP